MSTISNTVYVCQNRKCNKKVDDILYNGPVERFRCPECSRHGTVVYPDKRRKFHVPHRAWTFCTYIISDEYEQDTCNIMFQINGVNGYTGKNPKCRYCREINKIETNEFVEGGDYKNECRFSDIQSGPDPCTISGTVYVCQNRICNKKVDITLCNGQVERFRCPECLGQEKVVPPIKGRKIHVLCGEWTFCTNTTSDDYEKVTCNIMFQINGVNGYRGKNPKCRYCREINKIETNEFAEGGDCKNEFRFSDIQSEPDPCPISDTVYVCQNRKCTNKVDVTLYNGPVEKFRCAECLGQEKVVYPIEWRKIDVLYKEWTLCTYPISGDYDEVTCNTMFQIKGENGYTGTNPKCRYCREFDKIGPNGIVECYDCNDRFRRSDIQYGPDPCGSVISNVRKNIVLCASCYDDSRRGI